MKPEVAVYQRASLLQLVLLIGIALSGCAPYAAIDYDTGARFDGYKSYRFAENGKNNVLSLDASRIEPALKKALEQEGFVLADSGDKADLKVRYGIEQERRIESHGPRYSLGFGFGHHPFGLHGGHHSYKRAREIKEGQLVVNLVDTERQQVIWEGVAKRNLTESMGPRDRTRLINRVVKAMFEQYPPGE